MKWSWGLLLFSLQFFSACVWQDNKLVVTGLKSAVSGPSVQVSAVQINASYDKIIISGVNLDKVTQVQIQTKEAWTLSFDSQSSSQIVASVLNLSASALNLAMETSYNLLISTAYATTPVIVTFTLPNNSVTTNHIVNGTIAAVDLATMGAASGQFLQFNGANWTPASISSGLTFKGSWNANTDAPNLAVTNDCGGAIVSGEYYIVSTAGATTVDAISIWAVGDWVVCSSTGTYQKIIGASPVLALDNLTDVSATTPTVNQILQHNGANWIAADLSVNQLSDVDTVTSPPVLNQVLKWDGANWTPQADSLGSGAVASVNTQSGVVTLDTDDITEGVSNYYFTQTRARNSVSAGNGISYVVGTGVISANFGTALNTVAQGNHTHADATLVTAGFMSATDKTKLDNLPTDSVQDADFAANGFMKRTAAGVYSVVSTVAPADITACANGEILKVSGGVFGCATDLSSSSAQVESYIADDVTTGYIPYDDGTKLTTSGLFWDNTNSRLGVGTIAPIGDLDLVRSSAYTAFRIRANTTNSVQEPVLNFQKNHNATEGVHGATVDGENLGQVGWNGNTGTGFAQGAFIYGIQNGTAGASFIPTDIRFSTSDGVTANAPRMIIKSTGKVGIGSTDPLATLDISNTSSSGALTAILGHAIGDTNFLLSAKKGLATNLSGDEILAFGLSYNPAIENANIRFHRGGASSGGFMSFTTNTDLERMRIDAAGNVGIGTTVPTEKLSVAGKMTATHICASNGSNCLDLTIPWNDTSANSYVNNSDVLNCAANEKLQMTVGPVYTWSCVVHGTYWDTDKLGVGVVTPTKTISVAGDAAKTIGQERNPAANTAGNNLTINSGGATSGATDKNGGSLILAGGAATGTGTSDIHFQTATAAASGTADNAPTTKMTILGNGNVGIGVLAPTNKLEIGDMAGLHNGYGLTVINPTYGAIILTTGNTGTNAALRVGSDNSTDLLRVQNNGNVGIGSASPAAKLDVGGTLKASSLIVPGLTTQVVTRALPTTINDVIEIGTWYEPNSAHNFSVTATASGSGFSLPKQYVFTASYCNVNCTTGVWYEVLPISSTGIYAGNDFAIDIMQNNGTQILSLRLRRTAGAVAANVIITMINHASALDIFNPLTGTSSVTAPAYFWPSQVLTQNYGKVGIGTTSPGGKLHLYDIPANDVASTALAILSRSRTTANATNYALGTDSGATKQVDAGITDSGYLLGSRSTALRNFTGTTADSGSLANLYAFQAQYGSFNTDGAATPIITNAYGIRIDPYFMTGSITNMYDLYLGSGASGGTVTNRYGIYQASSAAKNYFAGKVGIGTTVPDAALHVESSGAYSYNAIGATPKMVLSDSGGSANLIFGINGAGTHSNAIQSRDGSAASWPLALNPYGGNVGIGTYLPAEKFTVAGTSLAGNAVVTNMSSLAGSGIKLQGSIANAAQNGLYYSSGGGGAAAMVMARDGSYGTFLDFYTNSTSNTSGGGMTHRMRIDQDGLVGIGTTAPARELHLSSTNGSQIKLQGTTGSWNGLDFLSTSYDAYMGMLEADGRFFVDVDSNGEDLTILQNGNVGIGTTNPSSKLSVDTSFSLGISGSWAEHLKITEGSSPIAARMDFAGDGSGWRFDIGRIGVGSPYMTVTDTGSVGIGTTGPDAMLSVNGTASKAGGGAWATFSDIRLKDVIGEYNYGLDEILKIRPIFYHYKENNVRHLPSREQYIGIVAQELQEIIPEAISLTKDGYLMVNNDPVLWAMVNAFKDVDKRFAENIMKFETMKNGIEELRQDMREAKRAIASLQEKVEILDEQNKKISNENSQMKAALCSLSKKFIFCR